MVTLHHDRHRKLSPARVLLPALLVALCALIVSGCGSATVEQQGTGSTPVKGGTLRLVGQPTTLDPAVCADLDSAMVDHCLYETLYAYAARGGESGMKLEPGLAAEMPQVSDGGKLYRITVRAGSRFAPPIDREVTASDVQYSFERMLREPRAVFTYFYSSVAGVQEFMSGAGEHVAGFVVVDPHTIEIRLTRPDPTIVYALTLAPSGVMPREWADKWGTRLGRHPLGSGPFMYGSWPHDGKVVLKRNPNYRDAQHVWLDGVEFVPYSNQLSDMMMLERGDLDACWLSQADWVKAKSDPKWKRYITEQLQVTQDFLVINTQMKPFDDVRVRQALSWAIDRDRLAKIEGCVPSYQILPEGMPGYTKRSRFYGYDPAKARALLAEAGYPKGFTTTISLPGNSVFASQAAEAIQQNFEAVRIRSDIRQRPQMVYYAELSTPKTIALGLSAWAMDFPDPYDWIKPLFSRDAAVKNGTNNSFWWDLTVERMLIDAQATLDPAQRVEKFSRMQEFVSEGAPIVPLYQLLAATLDGPHVGGFYIHPVYQFDPQHYWRQ